MITIEDAAELRLQQPHVLRLESRPANLEGGGEVTIRQLVRNALRMRPDRIIVGEVRGAEALDMLQALNTGHDGSMTTVHANTAADALRRIETLALMADVALPHVAVRQQAASAIDLVVHLERGRDGARSVVEIVEVVRFASEVGVRPLFSAADGELRRVGAGAAARMTGTLLAGAAGALLAGRHDPRAAAPRGAAGPAARSRCAADRRDRANRGRAARRSARSRAPLARSRARRLRPASQRWPAPLAGGAAAGPAGRRAVCGRRSMACAADRRGAAPALRAPPGRRRRRRPRARSRTRCPREPRCATSVAVAAERLSGPIAEELGRTAWELEMGAGTEAALERLRARSASRAVALIVAAMQVQRRSGGDLARVLRDVATALEQDRQVIEEANAATAQARFTAIVVVALPLCGIGLGALASPGLPARMTGSPLGAGLLHGVARAAGVRGAPDPPARAVMELNLAALCAAAATVLLVLGARDVLHRARIPSPVRLRSGQRAGFRGAAPRVATRIGSVARHGPGRDAEEPRRPGRGRGQPGQSAGPRLDGAQVRRSGSSHCSQLC